MKTPDEIKKGLKQCCDQNVGCNGCPYDNDCHDPSSTVNVEMDSLAYIQWLESRLAQVQRERDAAVRDLAKAMSLDGVEDCSFCKNIKKPYCDPCKWEWRGVCTENTKEE